MYYTLLWFIELISAKYSNFVFVMSGILYLTFTNLNSMTS